MYSPIIKYLVVTYIKEEKTLTWARIWTQHPGPPTDSLPLFATDRLNFNHWTRKVLWFLSSSILSSWTNQKKNICAWKMARGFSKICASENFAFFFSLLILFSSSKALFRVYYFKEKRISLGSEFEPGILGVRLHILTRFHLCHGHVKFPSLDKGSPLLLWVALFQHRGAIRKKYTCSESGTWVE